MANPEKEYALYKGDELIGMGTKKELAKQLGVKPQTIHFYATPSYTNRTSEKRGRRLVPLDNLDTLK